MSSIDELKGKLDRIGDGVADERDITALRGLIEGKPTTVSRGNRAVAVGGDVIDSIIVTGDGNLIVKGGNFTIKYEGLKAEQIRKALDLLPPHAKSFVKAVPLIIVAFLLIVSVVAAGRISYLSNLADVLVNPYDFTYSQLCLAEMDGTGALTQATLFFLTSWFILMSAYAAIDFDPGYLQKWLSVGTPMLLIGITVMALPLTILVRGYGSSITFTQILTIEYYRAGGAQILITLLMACMLGTGKLNRPLYDAFISHYRKGDKWDGRAGAENVLRSKAYWAGALIAMLGSGAIGIWFIFSSSPIEEAIMRNSSRTSFSDGPRFLWAITEFVVLALLALAKRGLIDDKGKFGVRG